MGNLIKRFRELMGITPEEPHIDNLIVEARDRYEAMQLRRKEAIKEMERNTMEEYSYVISKEQKALMLDMLKRLVKLFDEALELGGNYPTLLDDIQFLQEQIINKEYWESDRMRLKEIREEYIKSIRVK